LETTPTCPVEDGPKGNGPPLYTLPLEETLFVIY